jgi:hypothetical protein
MPTIGVVSPVPSTGWHFDGGEDELLDVVAPLVTAKPVGPGGGS